MNKRAWTSPRELRRLTRSNLHQAETRSGAGLTLVELLLALALHHDPPPGYDYKWSGD